MKTFVIFLLIGIVTLFYAVFKIKFENSRLIRLFVYPIMITVPIFLTIIILAFLWSWSDVTWRLLYFSNFISVINGLKVFMAKIDRYWIFHGHNYFI